MSLYSRKKKTTETTATSTTAAETTATTATTTTVATAPFASPTTSPASTASSTAKDIDSFSSSVHHHQQQQQPQQQQSQHQQQQQQLNFAQLVPLHDPFSPSRAQPQPQLSTQSSFVFGSSSQNPSNTQNTQSISHLNPTNPSNPTNSAPSANPSNPSNQTHIPLHPQISSPNPPLHRGPLLRPDLVREINTTNNTPYVLLVAHSAMPTCRDTNMIKELRVVAMDPRYETMHESTTVVPEHIANKERGQNYPSGHNHQNNQNNQQGQNVLNNPTSLLSDRISEPIHWDFDFSPRSVGLLIKAETYINTYSDIHSKISKFKALPQTFKFLIFILDSSPTFSKNSPGNARGGQLGLNSSSLQKSGNFNQNSHSNWNQNSPNSPNLQNSLSSSSPSLLPTEITAILTDLNLLAMSHNLHLVYCSDRHEAARYLEVITILERETASGTKNLAYCDAVLHKPISTAPSYSGPSSLLDGSGSVSGPGLTVVQQQVRDILGPVNWAVQGHRDLVLTALSSLPMISQVLAAKLLAKYPSMAEVAAHLGDLVGGVDGFGQERSATLEKFFLCDFQSVLERGQK